MRLRPLPNEVAVHPASPDPRCDNSQLIARDHRLFASTESAQLRSLSVQGVDHHPLLTRQGSTGIAQHGAVSQLAWPFTRDRPAERADLIEPLAVSPDIAFPSASRWADKLVFDPFLLVTIPRLAATSTDIAQHRPV
jgi:hypothetical protein